MFMTDRCYCQICKFVADVIPLGPVCRMADDIAIVAVVVTTICNWNMIIVADVIATFD